MEHYLQIRDNGGETIDRYTVLIGRSVYGMSINPNSAQGFNQYSGELPYLTKRYGKRVKFSELPEAVRIAIVNRQ